MLSISREKGSRFKFEFFNGNYLVNYAVGIRVLGELNLAEKTLYDFRARIYRYLA
jgi:hypothetical protein